MKASIKELFRTYLANCVQTRRQTGKSFVIGKTTVDSYVSFAEVDKLFDYAPEKWVHISSIYDITSSEKVLDIIEELSEDDTFKIKDSEGTSQYFRSNAIKQYYCFLKAREIFTGNIERIEIETGQHEIQQIFYGAPGTGKSNTIKKVVDEQKKRRHRTTFHPDSDYSTFVGAYKPTMKESYITKDGVTTKEEKIIYTFCPQAFTNAYVEAWNTEEEVYLIIEEINRGNCAQIFGDLFQLLDRKNGVSEYPVEADTDLQNYLSKALAKTSRTDIPEDVKFGKKLMLPSNLYIWATMNTSDQSLFPIDSAFKRRWEWKYIKIKEGKDEHGNKLDWKVDVKMDESGTLLSWWDFIKKINEIIASMTSSADKQLGYFFCCAKNGVIDEETFVSKVIFYLWNDVFKDYGFEDASLFRYTTKDENGKETEKDLTFPDFYDEEGEKVNTERLTDFVKKVMNWKAVEKKDYD